MRLLRHNLLQVTIWFGLICTILSLFGPNPLLCLPAFISLYYIIRNLLLSKYISAFFVAFLYQWSQVSIKVLYATITLTDVHQLTDFPTHIIEAYILSTLALIIVSYGISISLKKINIGDREIETYLNRMDFKKVVILYFFMGLIAEGTKIIPGFSQFSVVIAGFKWSLFYLIFLYCYIKKRYKILLYCIVGYEICIGFFSYFASWKTVVFYVLISSFAILQFKVKHILYLFIGGCITIYVALTWTGIKGEYRSFLSKDGQQVVVVSGADAYRKLFDLSSEFQVSTEVQKAFLDRMSYIDYFSSCLAYVPRVVPHEAGFLTWQAIKHVFMPRFFFPNKPIVDESSHLTKYTGVFYSNYSMGVSFSLGYVGDFYIDYGYIGMFLALFILGVVIGRIFKNIFDGLGDKMLAVAIMSMGFLILYKFEVSMLKLVGNLAVFWIFFRIAEFYLFPRFINYFRVNDK